MDFQRFLGLDAPTEVTDLHGRRQYVRRTYLDSAATCLMPEFVHRAQLEYLETASANSHTHANPSGRATTDALEHARQAVGDLVGYDPQRDAVVFLGTGATEPSNLVAAALGSRCGDRPLVAVSVAEHHSNLLPWRRAFGEQNVRYIDVTADGQIDLGSLDRVLRADGPRIRAVAVTALSNVSGAITPLPLVGRMVHAAGAKLAVDGAQAAAHVPIRMHGADGEDIDCLVLSGHKLYAPGSPGVLLCDRSMFEGCGWDLGMVGGGTVDRVDLDDVDFHSDPTERLEAGTPNIPGAIGLGAAAKVLRRVGMERIREHEKHLVELVFQVLQSVPDIVIFGPLDPHVRAGVVTFNVGELHHSIVACALADYFGIAVRNDCFCAQPFVRQQLETACEQRGVCPVPVGKPGMVRASFGVYTTEQDVHRLGAALRWIAQHRDVLESCYTLGEDGEYHHRSFRASTPYDLSRAVEAATR